MVALVCVASRGLLDSRLFIVDTVGDRFERDLSFGAVGEGDCRPDVMGDCPFRDVDDRIAGIVPEVAGVRNNLELVGLVEQDAPERGRGISVVDFSSLPKLRSELVVAFALGAGDYCKFFHGFILQFNYTL